MMMMMLVSLDVVSLYINAPVLEVIEEAYRLYTMENLRPRQFQRTHFSSY